MAANAPAQDPPAPEPSKQPGPPHPVENMQAMMNLVVRRPAPRKHHQSPP